MSVHLSEEEQLESLKRWWATYGTMVAVLVVLAIAGFFGWEFWKGQKRQSAEQASALYGQIIQLIEKAPQEGLSDDQKATLTHLSGQLQEQFTNNLYAIQSAFYQAKVAADAGDLDQAAQHLTWVVDQNGDSDMALLARVRLARVRLAQGQNDAVLDLAKNSDNSSFAASMAELRGDALLALGREKDARAAYSLALDSLLPAESQRRPLLEMKLDDLQAPTAEAGATDATTSENS